MNATRLIRTIAFAVTAAAVSVPAIAAGNVADIQGRSGLNLASGKIVIAADRNVAEVQGRGNTLVVASKAIQPLNTAVRTLDSAGRG
jgi:phage/plasmid primase-like uncharacterized protein